MLVFDEKNLYKTVKMDRVHLLKSLQQTIAVAKSRETIIHSMRDFEWCKKLKVASVDSLVKKFKFVLGNCKFSTIYVVHKKGPFSTPELRRQAANCVRSRNVVACSRAEEILLGK